MYVCKCIYVHKIELISNLYLIYTYACIYIYIDRDIDTHVHKLELGRPGFHPRSSHTKDLKNGT